MNEIRHDVLDGVMARASEAAHQFAALSQEHTDEIVTAAYRAGFNHRMELAEMAFAETHLGVVRHKILKNILATRHVWQDIHRQKTVGIIREDTERQIVEIAQPIGPIFAVTPITNPTSTVLFKILIALKTRNPLVIRPHGAARNCSVRAAELCYAAAREAGAPEHCIQWVPKTSEAETLALMAHKRTALVLATGSVSLVRAAYSSGNPAIGVGPGNVPCHIGMSAQLDFAVDQILLSKTFDNGTVCASEQSVVVKRPHAEEVLALFRQRLAYTLSPEEVKRLEPVAFNNAQRVMRVDVIGQSAHTIAAMAGIDVPTDTTVLIAPLTEVGLSSPLSLEILAPILGFYVADDFDHAIALCRSINSHGGLGHTATIFSEDEERIGYFAAHMNAGRILVNTPASQGALGATYNALTPSLMLGTGTHGKTSTTDNISIQNLLNTQRIARRRVNPCVECMDKYCTDPTIDAAVIEERCTRYKGGDPCATTLP